MIQKFLLGSLVAFSISFAAIAEEKAPKYGPMAEPLSRGTHSAYFKAGPGPDFQHLISFYQGQDTGSSCSLATLLTLTNAIQSMELKTKNTADLKNYSFKSIRESLLDSDYVDQMSGDEELAKKKNIKLGISIVDFKGVVEKALTKAEFTSAKPAVTLVQLKKEEGKHRAAEKAKFLSDLKANEKSANDFMILNFVQGVLTGDPEGMVGHMALVGAYDQKAGKVLMLDPDREYYQPYWASADQVFKAIVHEKADRKAPGYLVIRVK